jgi:phenolic acid decarboxylase
MNTQDSILGEVIRWTFSDGPLEGRSFEHTFHEDGTVEFRTVAGDTKGKLSRAKNSEVARVGDDVYAVSYLGPSGHTLSVVLDFRTSQLVAFASNEKELTVQRGTFELES